RDGFLIFSGGCRRVGRAGTIPHFVDELIQRNCPDPRRCGNFRSDFVLGVATHARNRPPYGSWRATAQRVAPEFSAAIEAGIAWLRHRSRGRTSAFALDGQPALWSFGD